MLVTVLYTRKTTRSSRNNYGVMLWPDPVETLSLRRVPGGIRCLNKVRFGVVDMLNNKICDLQRRACGHRDEDYLTLKIVAGLPASVNAK